MDFSYLIGTKNMGSAGATFQYLVFRSEQVHLSPFYIVTYVHCTVGWDDFVCAYTVNQVICVCGIA